MNVQATHKTVRPITAIWPLLFLGSSTVTFIAFIVLGVLSLKNSRASESLAMSAWSILESAGSQYGVGAMDVLKVPQHPDDHRRSLQAYEQLTLDRSPDNIARMKRSNEDAYTRYLQEYQDNIHRFEAARTEYRALEAKANYLRRESKRYDAIAGYAMYCSGVTFALGVVPTVYKKLIRGMLVWVVRIGRKTHLAASKELHRINTEATRNDPQSKPNGD